MHVKRHILTLIILTIGSTFFFLGGVPAFAAPINNATNTLKVSPVRRDVEIKPGETQKIQTTVTNLTNTPITVRPVQNDFIAGDDRGTPALILDETKYAPTHSLKRFMAPIENVTIPANSTKAVDLVITIPADAQAGGYFGAVRFAPIAPGGGGQVNLSASVASIILVTVPGKIVEKLELTQFVVQQNGRSSEIFGSPDNLQIAARFQNKGSVQEGPFGKVSILKDGKKVVYETDFNNKDPRDVILPDSARRWDIPVKDIGDFGHYTVSATFTYGKNNQTINIMKSFWVVPQMIIIAVIVGVILLISLLVGISSLIRRRRRGSRKHSSGLSIRR